MSALKLTVLRRDLVTFESAAIRARVEADRLPAGTNRQRRAVALATTYQAAYDRTISQIAMIERSQGVAS